jgi:hypothetical protein
MSTQSQSLFSKLPQVPGPVTALTAAQRHTIELAVELIAAANERHTLAEYLQHDGYTGCLYAHALTCAVTLLDQAVAIVDERRRERSNGLGRQCC